MYHTDFYNAIQAIEELAKAELTEALKTIGGEFMPDYNSEELDEIILVGAFKHSEGSEDILFTRAVANEYGGVEIYGKPYHEQSYLESRVEFLEAGYIGYIIDAIPEINISKVNKDIRRSQAIYKVRKALRRFV